MERNMCKRKKTGLLLLAAITVLLSWAGLGGSAKAATFTNVIDWPSGWTITAITESNTYTHILEGLSSPEFQLTSATLTLEYYTTNKWWDLRTTGGIDITGVSATLARSNTIAVYTLTNNALDEIMGVGTNPWQLGLEVFYNKLSGGGGGGGRTKKITLYKSTLSGTYVPIPGSALLLGSGVLCLIVIGRRRRTKKE